jgi:hypothetical protein
MVVLLPEAVSLDDIDGSGSLSAEVPMKTALLGDAGGEWASVVAAAHV